MKTIRFLPGLAGFMVLCMSAFPVAMSSIFSPVRAATADDAPYLRYEGGGFIFNYRVAIAYYGIVVRPARPMPKGTVIEARFADPDGGPEIVVSKTYEGGARAINFQTPPVHGVKADTDYPVNVALRIPDGNVLDTYHFKVHSDLDQSVLPEKPPVVGPGYQKNTSGEPGPGALTTPAPANGNPGQQ